MDCPMPIHLHASLVIYLMRCDVLDSHHSQEWGNLHHSSSRPSAVRLHLLHTPRSKLSGPVGVTILPPRRSNDLSLFLDTHTHHQSRRIGYTHHATLTLSQRQPTAAA